MASENYAIIIHYGSSALTHELVRCLARDQNTHQTQVIIIDNASPEPFLIDESHPSWIKVIRIAEGVGYGKACERGVQEAKKDPASKNYLILNNDLSFDGDLLAPLLSRLKADPKIGLIAPALIFPDGRFQLSWGDDLTLRSEYQERKRQRQMHRDGLGPLYLERKRQSAAQRTVDWVTGAVFILTRAAHDRIQTLDGGYFFYFEDVDWCKRVRLAGYSVVFNPDARVKHALGASRPLLAKQTGKALRFHRLKELGHLRYYAKFNSWLEFTLLKLFLIVKAFRMQDPALAKELLCRGRKKARLPETVTFP